MNVTEQAMTKEWTDKFQAAYEKLGSLGERVLGFAYRCGGFCRFPCVGFPVGLPLCLALLVLLPPSSTCNALSCVLAGHGAAYVGHVSCLPERVRPARCQSTSSETIERHRCAAEKQSRESAADVLQIAQQMCHRFNHKSLVTAVYMTP